MSKREQRLRCKDCAAHWTHGRKDGIHDNWCCKFSKSAIKALGHCKNVNGKVDKDVKV